MPQSTVLARPNLPSVTDANWTPPAWIRSIPAYSGTAVRLDTPGTTSKSMPPADAGRGLVGHGVVQERVTGDQPDDAGTGGGVLEHDLGPSRRGQRPPRLGQADGGHLRPVGQGDRRMRPGSPVGGRRPRSPHWRRPGRRSRPASAGRGHRDQCRRRSPAPGSRVRWEPWGSGSEGYGPKMYSLTSRVLLCAPAESSYRRGRWKVGQRGQDPTCVVYPEVPRFGRGAAAPRIGGRSPLGGVLPSCSVTFSQLPPSESNRRLYHGQI